jgi:prepilin-type N-terminal cleavage/methylation domain-containing protein
VSGRGFISDAIGRPIQRRGHFTRPPAFAAAFTLVEILIVVIILGILATLVIPQFSNASQQARENTLKDELRYLRTQIIVYKAQHQDVPPGYPSGNPAGTPDVTDFVNQMTMHSDINCDVSTPSSNSYCYGPYLSQMPTNPINGMTTVIMVGNNQAMPAVDGTTGWIYQAQTQDIIANVVGNDSTGSSYANY